jgi:catechol 2,3-dioxygenase-like lactoylglutathione lyase family enzyme
MTIEIDHISLSVADYDKAKAFYTAALAPLGISALMEFPMDNGSKVVGLGPKGRPFLWINGGEKQVHTHIALRAETRQQVDAFYSAAIAAGGIDNGGPGIREMYHPNYYAAFVLDPDGHNIEAVVHTPPAAAKRSAPARRNAAKPARKVASSAKKKPVARKAAAKKPAGRKKPAARKPARKTTKKKR